MALSDSALLANGRNQLFMFAAGDEGVRCGRVGMNDDELHRVSTSSFIPDPGIGPYVRGQYRGPAMPNAITYMLAVAAIAYSTARRHRRSRGDSRMAERSAGRTPRAVFAVIGTAIGIALWASGAP